MRRFVVSAAFATLIACGEPGTSATPGAAEAQAQTAQAQTAQKGAVPASAQADYIARCTREMIAQNPRAGEWAPGQCQQQWETIVAAGPMAEAILAAAPVSGAADPSALHMRLTMVRWDARPEGTLIASGRLGSDLGVQVDRAGPSLTFSWGKTGELIPYDVVEALRVRGPEVTIIGCSSFGGGENNVAYRVVAADRAPFVLSVYSRTAPTANAESFYNVGMALNGQVQTLAQLRRDGSDWGATCPY